MTMLLKLENVGKRVICLEHNLVHEIWFRVLLKIRNFPIYVGIFVDL